MEPGTFEVLPSVLLRKRRLVDPAGEVLDRDPVPRLRDLAAKGPLYLVDLDGLGRNKADLDTLRKVAEKGNVWIDAGSRFATDAMDALVAGAERITLRWSHLASEEELREAHELSDALVLGLEFQDGAFVRNPLLDADDQRAAAVARELGLAIVALDTTRFGGHGGGDRGLAARFASTGLDRWYAGGLRDASDARDLETLGYRGAVLDPPRPAPGGPL